MAGRYARGVAFEHQCMQYFEDLGYKVIRSAGSHGPADLICGHKDEGTLLVQCRMRGNLSKEERVELREWAEDFGGARILVAYIVKVKGKKNTKEFRNI